MRPLACPALEGNVLQDSTVSARPRWERDLPTPATRVLVVLHDPRWGGPKGIALNIGCAMKEAGWPWVVLLPREATESAERLRAAGLEVLTAPIGRVRKLTSPSAVWMSIRSALFDPAHLASIIRQHDIGVVQAAGLHNFQAPVAARLTGRALVWQIHASMLPAAARLFLSPFAISMADVIMTNGLTAGEKFPGVRRLGNRRTVFYAPVDCQLFRYDSARRLVARNVLGASPSDIVIGTLGNRAPVKGHDIFLRAVRRIILAHEEVKVRVLAAPVEGTQEWYEREVLSLAQTLNAQRKNSVSVVDPHGNVAAFLNGLDIFAMPSRAEGVPLAIAEAMASELPVVSFDVGSIAEVVAHGQTGFIVPAGNEEAFAARLEVLVEQSMQRRDMGVRGRKRIIDDFGIGKVVEAHVRAYEAAVKNAASRRAQAGVGTT